MPRRSRNQVAYGETAMDENRLIGTILAGKVEAGSVKERSPGAATNNTLVPRL
jgi:hypothetical protein